MKFKVQIRSVVVNTEVVESPDEDTAWEKANDLIGEVDLSEGEVRTSEVDSVEEE